MRNTGKPEDTAVKPTKARIELARTFLKQFNALERKNTTAEGWIALKFSCTAKEAKALIAAVDRADAPPATDPKAARLIVCPDCRADVQASITFDCDVDSHTGQIDRALTGGGVKLYCSMDCGWEREHADLVSVDDWPAPITADDLTPSEGGR